MSESESAALQLSLNRGLDLYRYDQAAWRTTDTLRKDIKDLSKSGIQGWVITKVADGLLSTFWKPEGNSYRGVYSAVWDGSKVTRRKALSGVDAALSSEQLDLVLAQSAVLSAKPARCSKSPFNTVVLPPAASGEPTLVYLLTPQSNLSAIPMGGHYRFSVVEGKVADQRAFTNTCIELGLTAENNQNGKPEALFISHVLDPVPTEIHVFSTFAAKVPIYVSTTSNKALWVTEISSGQPRVRLIEKK